jgi:hypothetical protein
MRARLEHYSDPRTPLGNRVMHILLGELEIPAPSELPPRVDRDPEMLPIDAEQIAIARASIARGLLAFNLTVELERPISEVMPSAPRLMAIRDPVRPDASIGEREPTFGEYVATAHALGDKRAIDAIDAHLRSRQHPGAKRVQWPDILLRYRANARLIADSLARRRTIGDAARAWTMMCSPPVDTLPHSYDAELADVLRALDNAHLKAEWLKPRPAAKELARQLTAVQCHVSPATLKKELVRAARQVPPAAK